MRRNRLFVVFLVLAGFSVNAESVADEVDDRNDHFLSFGFSLGLLAGTSEEIVYRSSSSDNFMSQLIWPLDPLFYLGIDAGYSWQGPANPENVFERIFSGFFLDASVKFGLPGDTGPMEDRDWIRQPTWALSHYSLHDNTVEFAIIAGLAVGKSFKL